jgi:hypothetical protein
MQLIDILMVITVDIISIWTLPLSVKGYKLALLRAIASEKPVISEFFDKSSPSYRVRPHLKCEVKVR